MSGPAPAALRALADATAAWPNRRKASDGIMGDASHRARKSDHNLGNAFDITHDPENGCDADAIAIQALADERTTYVIRAGKIASRDRLAEGWRPYTGANPHNTHVHVSIAATKRDDARPWFWAPELNKPGAKPWIDRLEEGATKLLEALRAGRSVVAEALRKAVKG